MKKRSFLFVPAKEKMLEKIPAFNADGIIADLEDSIEPVNKQDALEKLSLWLPKLVGSHFIVVRLNKEFYAKEFELLDRFSVGFMLPKFECCEDYPLLKQLAEKHEIWALIETPKGMAFVEQVAACPHIKALAFGAEDFSASMGIKNDFQYLHYYKSRMVMYARAYKKNVFDTPSFHLNDPISFHEEVDQALALGFDGKMAIHPKQTSYINSAFQVNDPEEMKRIIQAYEAEQKAVSIINGKVYEKMHIDHMKRKLNEGGN